MSFFCYFIQPFVFSWTLLVDLVISYLKGLNIYKITVLLSLTCNADTLHFLGPTAIVSLTCDGLLLA